MSRARRMLATLAHDKRGAAALEFGFVALPMCIMLLGAFDLGYQFYVQSVLDGGVQKAARDATIVANGNTSAIDAVVKTEVLKVAKDATFVFTRKSYSDFSGVGKPEKYKDANSNAKYDTGECFEDINGNGKWDADLGKTGLGGADDIVYYQVEATYKRLVGIKLLGRPAQVTAKAMTVLRNQPYAAQTKPTVASCS